MSVAAVNADTAVAFSTPDGHVSFFTPRRATSLEEVVPMTMASPRLVSAQISENGFRAIAPYILLAAGSMPTSGGGMPKARRRC